VGRGSQEGPLGTSVRAPENVQYARWIAGATSSRVAEASFLSQSDLFAALPAADCLSLAAAASLREYSRDDLIFEQGQPSRHVILILSGCIKMTQIGSEGSEVILWLRGSLDAIGIFARSMPVLHSCSARAILPSRALIWEWTRLHQSPCGAQIQNNIGHIVSERLEELEERFREVATENVERRVASAIGRIGHQVGKPTSEGMEIFLSREELAQLTGTTLFSVSRLMSKWSELGIVRPRREGFVVLNFDRLTQISRASGDDRPIAGCLRSQS
jgi:CRP-like cAMP-binding protein